MPPYGWKEYTLAEVTENFDSKRIPVRKADREKGPYPYYGASGVVDFVDDYIFDGEYLLVAEDGANLESRNVPIAFMATGKFWVNNHAHVLRGNGLADTRYLQYIFRNKDISAFLSGSTRPKLTQKDLNRIPVRLPPVDEQREIVSILGALDDRIDLNGQMNETLESMARAMFKSWFVDFDPVIDNALHAGNPIPEQFGDRAAARREALEAGNPVVGDEVGRLFPECFEESDLGPVPVAGR
jgi:type I restriction enzyme S subunit